MGWEPTLYSIVMIAGGVLTAWLTGVAWCRQDRTGATAFTVMIGAISVWCFSNALQYGATTYDSYLQWRAIGYLGPLIAPPAGLVFVMEYVGLGRWITRRSVSLLVAVPAATTLLLATNDFHGLLWAGGGVSFTTDPIPYAPLVPGPWMPVHLVYLYAVMVLMIGLLVRFLARSRGPYRQQAGLMLVAVLAPLTFHLMWLFDVSPISGVDLSPLAFTVTGILFAFGLFSFDLLNFAPVARHTVVEEVRDGVITIDRDGRVIDANPAGRRLLSTDGDLVGSPASEAVPRYEDIRTGEEVEDLAIEVEDERRYFDVQVSTLTDAAGTAVGEVLLLRDVTERRRVEKRYQVLTENSSDIIHVVDPHWKVEYVSPSIRRVLGFRPGHQEGENALDYVHPDDREEVAERLQEILDRPDEELRVEYRARTADGTYVTLESRGRNLLENPVVEGIVINSRDVSERKRREQRLRRQNRQLEEFANVISHDLRSPLTVARGYADLLAGEYDDERLDRVQDAHGRMDQLLEDLLELAREGRVVDDPEPVDLTTAAREAWTTVDTESATLSVDGTGEVLADPSRLRELLENLFCNAVEHGTPDDPGGAGSTDGLPDEAADRRSDDGRPGADADGDSAGPDEGVAVTVEIGRLENGTGFYVQDDGPGIPEDERDQVFEPGYSTSEEGTGFGLAIVKEIVDAHGWRVAVAEAEGSKTDGQAPDASEVGEAGEVVESDGGDGRGATAGGARFEFTGVVEPN